MRKINLFWINRKPNITFFNKIKNSLLEEIKIEDGIFTTFFHSYWNKPEKIQIVLINLWNLDKKDLMVFFSKIIKISFDTAKRLSRENMPEYCNYYEKELLSTIDSCLIKINYSKEKDLFYFLANIFFNLLITHKLPNGNKRIAVSILIKFLYYFGYYFKFQKNDYKSNRDWETKSINFISRAETKKENEEIIICDIRKWILKNILISLNIK